MDTALDPRDLLIRMTVKEVTGETAGASSRARIHITDSHSRGFSNVNDKIEASIPRPVEWSA